MESTHLQERTERCKQARGASEGYILSPDAPVATSLKAKYLVEGLQPGCSFQSLCWSTFFQISANDQLFVHDVIQTRTGQLLPFGFDLTTSICRVIFIGAADLSVRGMVHTSIAPQGSSLRRPGPPHRAERGTERLQLPPEAAESLSGIRDGKVSGRWGSYRRVSRKNVQLALQ
ncbi:uncharacterized protein V6R79_022596 [Siganus canaliculatus]